MSDVQRVQITAADLQAIGKRYEDRYGGFIQIFKRVSDLLNEDTTGARAVVVSGAPYSWVPLLRYMGALVEAPIAFFGSADQVAFAVLRQNASQQVMTRSVVEALCALRPETVDALWKVDRQWKTKIRNPPPLHKAFMVTSNGSFDRPEIQLYEQELAKYVPTKKKVVLVPCAADKPYPSPMHKAVLERMPDDFYLANVTGVLGIVPMDLWPVMPHYDSGIPNEWRCMNVLKNYFAKFEHEEVIVYCDFYTPAIDAAFTLIGQKAWFVNPIGFYADYIDLLDPARLVELEATFKIAKEAS